MPGIAAPYDSVGRAAVQGADRRRLDELVRILRRPGAEKACVAYHHPVPIISNAITPNATVASAAIVSSTAGIPQSNDGVLPQEHRRGTKAPYASNPGQDPLWSEHRSQLSVGLRLTSDARSRARAPKTGGCAWPPPDEAEAILLSQSQRVFIGNRSRLLDGSVGNRASRCDPSDSTMSTKDCVPRGSRPLGAGACPERQSNPRCLRSGRRANSVRRAPAITAGRRPGRGRCLSRS